MIFNIHVTTSHKCLWRLCCGFEVSLDETQVRLSLKVNYFENNVQPKIGWANWLGKLVVKYIY